MTKKCLVYGASGHGKVVADIIKLQKEYQCIEFYDDNRALMGQTLNGYPILSELRKAKSSSLIIAIGNNSIRKSIFFQCRDNYYSFAIGIHPNAILSDNSTVGSGSVLMAGVVINSSTKVGLNSIINTHTSIEHDCIIGDHVHIAPGTTICGGSIVGDNTFIGAGSTIIENITIGKNVIVGAGSVVISPIADNQTVVGVPGKPLVKN